MPSSPKEPATAREGESPLADALDKNKEATAEVRQAADDLAVAHAVLDTKVTTGSADAEAKRAVAETAKVEKRLARSADKLEEVNEALAKEISRPT